MYIKRRGGGVYVWVGGGFRGGGGGARKLGIYCVHFLFCFAIQIETKIIAADKGEKLHRYPV